jgi:hypothetical protein
VLERVAYIFLDEGGNFDFSDGGTAWFSLTAVTKYRPFKCYPRLIDRRYDLLEDGNNIEYFHASHDLQVVRNEVFDVIEKNISSLRIDSVLVNKRKVGPALYPVEKFYPQMLGYLLRYVIDAVKRDGASEVIVITDQIPVRKKRQTVVKAVKATLSGMLTKDMRYRILHHSSRSNIGLQIADYCNWAIFRKWSSNDYRSYNLIRKAIRSEFDIFGVGKRLYY